ncbi:hypothetical protein [Sciscionella marina]|uniref:hypothetical protein n=1 Tax=Sciscionella marina TaxID=508770 RepID=UPI001969BD5B|nr:hypothetical protein [Sciscionella marina]
MPAPSSSTATRARASTRACSNRAESNGSAGSGHNSGSSVADVVATVLAQPVITRSSSSWSPAAMR